MEFKAIPEAFVLCGKYYKFTNFSVFSSWRKNDSEIER
jgi:hypothetical protein